MSLVIIKTLHGLDHEYVLDHIFLSSTTIATCQLWVISWIHYYQKVHISAW